MQNRSRVWSADYLPFGEVYNQYKQAATNEIRFPGQYDDKETGLYYNWHRYYEPTLGRYYQADKLASEDFKRAIFLNNLKFLFNNSNYNIDYLIIDKSLNPYSYVDNNPFIGVDPLGLFDNKEYYNDLNWWEKLERGYYYGTGVGEEAVEWYANKYAQTGKWYYATGGVIATMWTPEMWIYTASGIAAMGLAQVSGLSTRGPWIGKIEYHLSHSGGPHQYSHLQIMIRTGLHRTTSIRIPLYWLIKCLK